MTDTNDINATLLGDISTLDGSLAQRVYLTIKQAILALDFPPGTNLRKAPICEHLGVSRAPVTEAIARLAQDGLVDVVPQSGTHVSHFSMNEIREGVFLREALELATVAKITRDITDEQIKKLSRNMRLQELLVEDDDVVGFYQADEEFHHILMELTGFQRLPAIAHSVSLQITRARLLLLPTPGRVAETLDEHRRIFEAIRNRNVEDAQTEMRRHLGQLLPRIEALQAAKPDLFNKN
ncbi:GntR family transcriptional regulator [Thalassobius sp. Cn5-15]|jgi:DNA-binding GntR family transcriptional regulator|uniref:GntR family transcriptional regulator n=1 Tax=Thalassobius sp. Cn5-15 TaxID=2917763 RepID=UPI001EF32833|nr:GntR family transcriptional regulator [Thalassobius sp. Cn5-15]MCG7494442.1 GntR family transcriptional regulator [Thalassobius sp. Cn5-15]